MYRCASSNSLYCLKSKQFKDLVIDKGRSKPDVTAPCLLLICGSFFKYNRIWAAKE
jgi:hypothetical protein